MITLVPVSFILGTAFALSRGARRGGTTLIVACGMIAFSACVLHAQSTGKKVYKDPTGTYSVTVPSGWEAQPQEGSPMVSIVNAKTQISVTTGVMKGPEANTPSAESQLQGIQKQFPQSCPQAKIEEQGKQTLAGIPGAYMVVHCVTQSGPETMKFTAATKPGVVALMITASPGTAYLKELIPLMEISSSFKLLGASAPMQGMGMGRGQRPASMSGQNSMQGEGMGDPTAQAQSQSGMQANAGGNFPDPGQAGAGPAGGGGFHDPQGRYALTPPSGWNTAVDGNAGTATFSQGGSWATVATGSGAEPAAANHQIVQQIQAQYKDFKILNEGDFQNNGHPAHGTNATGINPKGVRVSVLVVSIGAGSSNYLSIISSAPNDQAQQINGVIMQMVNSVRFAGE
jgi:hypothetical protein